jgi:hypothetical protein
MTHKFMALTVIDESMVYGFKKLVIRRTDTFSALRIRRVWKSGKLIFSIP